MFRYIVAGVAVLLLLFFWLVMMPYIQEGPCPGCYGKGTVTRGIVEVPCPYCKGTGKVPAYKRDIILPEIEKQRRVEQEEKKAEEERMKKAAEDANNYPSDYQPSPAQ